MGINLQPLSIRYVLIKSKKNKLGLCPISCRLTLNGRRKVFSTSIMVKPSEWNSKQQLITKLNDSYEVYNQKLQLLRSKALTAQLELQVSLGTQCKYTVEDVYRLMKGEKKSGDIGLLEFYKSYLNKIDKLIDVEIKQVTWNKFKYIYNDIYAFIWKKYHKRDIVISKLDMKFINDLEYYYKVDSKLKQVTINKKIQRLKKVIREAVDEGHLSKHPFLLHKAKKVIREVTFLTTEELRLLEAFNFSQPRLMRAKNLFVFSCYTGLAYREVMNLESKHIKKGFDGNLWITMKRQKTSKLITVPLLPQALHILKLYKSPGTGILPKLSNQRYNSYLKEIAAIVGIDKRMTTHMARRTFASTVLLYNDVPMEIVSELLGHSSMKITQDSYGKVVQRKVSQEMERLKKLK